MIIALPELRHRIRERIYTVSCYRSEIGGYFRRHRDNLNAGAEHRRFAVSLNLNSNYEGCDLIFLEFVRRTYRAPAGEALPPRRCAMRKRSVAVLRGRAKRSP